MTKEELNSIILDSSRHDRFGNERVAHALPQLFEAVIQAWQERDIAIADGKAAFDLSQECRRRAVEAECERDALITKLAEAEEQVDALEMGYRGFP